MIVSPFGPRIYTDYISEDFHNFLLDSAKVSKKLPTNIGSKLAGNIEDQLILQTDPSKFVSFVHPHIKQYMSGCQEDKGLLNTIANKKPSIDYFNDLTFNLGGGPWINFQQKNEFNPLHTHSGALSSVIFIDIPEEIAKEKTVATNMPCNGQLEFVYADDGFNYTGTYKVIPKTKQIYLFPASLRHTVYPFTSDVERVTLSFNVFNIETYNKE